MAEMFFGDEDENILDSGDLIPGGTGDISFEEEEETIEEIPEEIIEEEIVEEEAKDTEDTEEIIEETVEKESTEEEIDLQSILDELDSEIDESNKTLDKIEEDSQGTSAGEIGILRDSLKKMEDQIKKINGDNIDLKFRNAELEAYGFEEQDPKLLSLSRNLIKAQNGDDRSKTKAISVLKDMLYELTGEDFDEIKIDSDIDLLTKAELYNNEVNPNLRASKAEEEGFAL